MRQGPSPCICPETEQQVKATSSSLQTHQQQLQRFSSHMHDRSAGGMRGFAAELR